MQTSRRAFLKVALTLAGAPGLLAANTPDERYPLAFSTLGCPRWEWRTVLDHAAEWGYAAIELRGLNGEMDLTKRPEFQGGRLAESVRDLEVRRLRIADLGASTRLHEADPKVRAAQLDEAKRYIDLAHQLKAPYIRVFGDRVVPGKPKGESVDRVITGLRELGEYATGSGVGVLLETHGDYCDSPTLLQVCRGAELPTTGLVWDTHHTFVAGKEPPAQTWEQLGRYVRHVHLKDSRPQGKDVRYVLTGEGTVPVKETIQLLVKQQYRGFYSLEWEKAWHPEIEEPEVAFPHFARLAREWMREAGWKRS